MTGVTFVVVVLFARAAKLLKSASGSSPQVQLAHTQQECHGTAPCSALGEQLSVRKKAALIRCGVERETKIRGNGCCKVRVTLCKAPFLLFCFMAPILNISVVSKSLTMVPSSD